ncbi:lipid-A-disaccharide synthase [Roseicitreum antarcticum]|uniref:Lipid-A-disaccharide synthase n=1 Tax=Roseicitreum antarcticum TaxID=564137 RepID=A0A1H3BRR1_9RHOB|nr:lipid-A-disaccharide synthase [Roseicitreum antarcticum]SDX44361.1 lipid-A-disaccharide synthase [Roseicitreum antarcticum]
MKVFIIAGEPSGDALGAALMGALRMAAPEVRFDGVGGDAMIAEGLTSRFSMSDLSVMGLAEVLPKYRMLRARIAQCAAAIAETTPDLVLTIDSPDFCLRVLRLARAARPDLPTVHYVAPSVWAWRPGRAAKMAPLVDHVLALLPFEPPYMQAAGMSCDFVGHPVTTQPQASADEIAALRARLNMAPGAPLILALPGSRKGEITRLGPRFGAALRLLIPDHPDARVVVPTVSGSYDTARAVTADWPGAPILLDPRDAEAKRTAFGAADLALAASGTVSLELAASRTPMVIAYDFNALSRFILWRLVKLDTVTLVNLVSETRAVPEFLGRDCHPVHIAPALHQLLADPAARAQQLAAMDLTMARLGADGPPPAERAARSVLDFMRRKAGRPALPPQ